MITASLVKELREKTGAGMMDCKKALEETSGDITKAIDWLREKGIAKAAKKSDRVAAEGLVKIATNGSKSVVVELNSETDFVAKNAQFLALLNDVAETVLASDATTLEQANELVLPNGLTIDAAVTDATATIGEKISFRRFDVVTPASDEIVGTYTHFDGRTAVLAVVKGGSADVAKDIAMQVASMSPSFVNRDEVDENFIKHEREIQEGIIANDESLAGKPENVLKGIVEGRLSKALQEMCLTDQAFFKNPDQKVAQYLKDNNATCVKFVRFVVGEGMEKKEDNFAAEVASMVQ